MRLYDRDVAYCHSDMKHSVSVTMYLTRGKVWQRVVVERCLCIECAEKYGKQPLEAAYFGIELREYLNDL